MNHTPTSFSSSFHSLQILIWLATSLRICYGTVTDSLGKHYDNLDSSTKLLRKAIKFIAFYIIIAA